MLRALVDKERPTKIVTVGDRVSKDLTDSSIAPDVMIVDNKIMRKKIPFTVSSVGQTVDVRNPAGTITQEAWSAIEKAIEGPDRTKIVVLGEEDLLALVAVLASPVNSFVIYGQPKEGVVVVKVTSESKQKVKRILGKMKKQPASW